MRQALAQRLKHRQVDVVVEVAAHRGRKMRQDVLGAGARHRKVARRHLDFFEEVLAR